MTEAVVPPSQARLEALEELVDSLRPVILADHTEHGLQGMSGLVGQYRAALVEIEALRAAISPAQESPFDQIAARRAEKAAAGAEPADGGRIRRR